MIDNITTNPLGFAISLAILIISIGIHEFFHAYAADRLGDPTPRLQGRLTLNPFAHIDLYGMIFLLFFGFGWGKPVQFDPFNLKDPRRDAAIISVVGPLSNFALAIIGAILIQIIVHLSVLSLIPLAGLALGPLVQINVLLGLFNLIPVHPLDGFKIVGGILPEEKAREWYELQRYGYILLLLLIIPFVGGRSMLDFILFPAMRFVLGILLPGAAM